MAVSKRLLSAASGGIPIALATAPTTLHTSISGSSSFDEVFVYVTNLASVSKQVTVYLGATTAAKNKALYTVPSRDGWYLLVPGTPLNLTKVVKAYATGGGANLTGMGWVNRIS